MKLFQTFVTVTTLIASIFTSANVLANTPQRTLTIGIEDGYYPYEYTNEQGQFTGLDVELINFVCQQMQVKCVLKRGAFEGLIPELIFRKTDLVISALAITDERKKRIDFSTPYIEAKPGVFIVNQNNAPGQVEQLKVVGVQQGTTLAVYLKQALPKNVQIKMYPSFDTAMLDLKGGRVDAVFESIDVSAKYLNDQTNRVQVLGEPVYSDLISQGTAIAVRKGNTELLAQINAALEQARSQGLLTQLYAKYDLNQDDKVFLAKQ